MRRSDDPNDDQNGTLYGVGTGPGDPELLTLKAVKVLKAVNVIAHFAKAKPGLAKADDGPTDGSDGVPLRAKGNARTIVECWIRPGVVELPLLYPVTTELDHNSARYVAMIDEFFDRASDRVASHLRDGQDVAVLSEGDPLFYGSYMHLHARLTKTFSCVVIPGITAMSGCWSLAGLPICQGEDAMTILPGTMAPEQLTHRLQASEAVVIMKVGRNLAKIRQALRETDRLADAVYVERGTMQEGFHKLLTDYEEETAPYFSLILVPGWRSKP